MTDLQAAIEKFHAFSKTPVFVQQPLGAAVNVGGHTIKSAEIRTEEVPFFSTQFSDRSKVPYEVMRDSVKNDVLKLHSEASGVLKFWKRNETPFSVSKSTWESSGYAVENFSQYWTAKGDTIESCLVSKEGDTTARYLANKKDKPVLKYYDSQNHLETLTDTNNSGQDSNKHAARMRSELNDTSSNFVDSFVVSTDVFRGGYPAVGFSPIIRKVEGTTSDLQVEGEDIWSVASSGIVLFEAEIKQTATYTIEVFEYIGKKLDRTLSGGVGGGVLLEALAIKQGKIIDNDIVEALTTIDPDLAQMNHTIVKVTIADETDI